MTLEFANYARVDVARRGTRRYDFAWWGQAYARRRDVDRARGTVSFRLVRDGRGPPVAHLVPDAPPPHAAWVPPCHLCISDPSVVGAVTDVAE